MFVYVVGLQHEPKFKIGVSSDVAKRMSELQVGNPYKIVKYAQVKFPSNARATQVETKVHFLLNKYHVSGEWFCCTFATIESAVDSVVNGTPFVDFDEFNCKMKDNVYVEPDFSISPLAVYSFLIAIVLVLVNIT